MEYVLIALSLVDWESRVILHADVDDVGEIANKPSEKPRAGGDGGKEVPVWLWPSSAFQVFVDSKADC